MADVNDLDATAQAALVASGEVKPLELVEQAQPWAQSRPPVHA